MAAPPRGTKVGGGYLKQVQVLACSQAGGPSAGPIHTYRSISIITNYYEPIGLYSSDRRRSRTRDAPHEVPFGIELLISALLDT